MKRNRARAVLITSLIISQIVSLNIVNAETKKNNTVKKTISNTVNTKVTESKPNNTPTDVVSEAEWNMFSFGQETQPEQETPAWYTDNLGKDYNTDGVPFVHTIAKERGITPEAFSKIMSERYGIKNSIEALKLRKGDKVVILKEGETYATEVSMKKSDKGSFYDEYYGNDVYTGNFSFNKTIDGTGVKITHFENWGHSTTGGIHKSITQSDIMFMTKDGLVTMDNNIDDATWFAYKEGFIGYSNRQALYDNSGNYLGTGVVFIKLVR